MLNCMEILPGQSEVFLLPEEDGTPVPDAIPPKVLEPLRFVEDAMRQGSAVQVIARWHELPIDEAAAAIGMGADELRVYAAEGEIPFRSSEYTDWVPLADVLALDERLRTQRRAALDEMLGESTYE